MKRRSIKNVSTYLAVSRDLKLNLALVGAHGRGKTKILQQYASENGYTLITLILSRFLPEDFLGLPVTKTVKGKKVTAYSNPDWLVKACDPNEKVLLFFDEFNNGDVDVQASILNLIEDRKMGDLTLADSTQIVMAFNPSSIAPNAKELSMATRDRICVIPIEDDVTAYSDYYADNKMKILPGLLNSMPEIITNHDEESVEAAYENAEFTFRSLEKSYKIYEYCTLNNINKSIIADMICGYGGKNGHSFISYMDAQWGDAEGASELIKLLNESENIDKFITQVRDKNLLTKYSNYVDLRGVVNQLESALPPKDFQKFLDSCVTSEFQSIYKLESVR